MTWKEYAEYVHEINYTALADRGYDLTHHALSLCSEAGELAGKVVKQEFRGSQSITKLAMRAELGDILYHLTALCTNLDTNLEELWEANAEKLKGRVQRNTLVGEGDDR